MSQSIEVIVRLRPSNKGNNATETDTEVPQIVSVEESSAKVVLNRNRNQAEYTFTRTFGPDADQSSVYSSCDVMPYVLDGVNCCVMTYGQTSTGKTYTMYGKGWEDTNALTDGKNNSDLLTKSLTLRSNTNTADDNDSVASAHDSGDDATIQGDDLSPESADHLGIIPRSINDLFDNLNSQQANKENFAYSISLQIMQIYNEKIYDLLHDRKRKNPLVIRETGAKDNFGSNVYVRGLSVYRIDSKADAFRLIKKAIRNKAVRSTELNSVSSRSHTVLQLFVMTEDADVDGIKVVRRSTLSLIDLAGSEKWRSSLSTTGSTETEAQVKEMTNINASLHVLGNCIAGLIESDRKHIPYRDSVLTRLLQSTLGGNGKSIIVATIHSDSEFVDETYSTLQFATRASKVKVTLAQNVGVSEKMSITEAQKHIKLLKKQLEMLRAGNAGSGIADITRSIGGDGLAGSGVVCEQCREFQQELSTLKQRVQALEEENTFLKQRCEEFNLNNSAFYSNQSSVESSPVVKSSSKKKKTSGDTKSSSKDKGILQLTSPMLMNSSLTAEPLHSIPEHRSSYNHHSDKSDLTEGSTSILASSLDRLLQQQQQKDHARYSYDSDSSSISGLHSILQAKSPGDIAAAALKAVSDFDNGLQRSSNTSHINQNPTSAPTNTSVSGSILGIQVPASSGAANKGTGGQHALQQASTPSALTSTFTATSTSGLPPPSPAISASFQRQSVNNQGHASTTTTNHIAASSMATPKATTSNPDAASSSVRSSTNLLSSLLGTPITQPIVLGNQGGVCQKHHLEDCILCAMFNPASSNAAGGSTTAAVTPAATAGNPKFSSTPAAGTTAAGGASSTVTGAAAPSVSSVTSSITSILKAANAHTNANSSTYLGGSSDTTPRGEEFGITTLRRTKTGSLAPSSAFKTSRSKDGDDADDEKCRHGLLNCFLCNGVPAFDFSTGNAGNNTARVGSSGGTAPPSRLHTLPPMSSANANAFEMISTLDSPHSKSSFPLSASSNLASSTTRTSIADRWNRQSTMDPSSFSSNNHDFSSYTATLGKSTAAAAAATSSATGRISSGDSVSSLNSHTSKRVQEIQAISQLRQSHQQEQQLLHQRLHPRSSSSPLPVTTDGNLLSGQQDSAGAASVRHSLVKQMRQNAVGNDDTSSHNPYTSKQPLRYQSHHAAQEEDEDADGDEDDDADEEPGVSNKVNNAFMVGNNNNNNKQKIIYYEDETDEQQQQQHSHHEKHHSAGDHDGAVKTKKLKKKKKKKVVSSKAGHSDTEGSQAATTTAHRAMDHHPPPPSQQAFENLGGQPRPLSKHSSHHPTATAAASAKEASANNGVGSEKVINHRTVMIALKGGKKK